MMLFMRDLISLPSQVLDRSEAGSTMRALKIACRFEPTEFSLKAESYNARIYFWISMVGVSKLETTSPLTIASSIIST
jgi:hypothetical protein